MPHYIDKKGQIHFLDGERFEHLLPVGSVKMNEEPNGMVTLPMPETTFDDIKYALQNAIDAKAKELGFSGGNALMLYSGFDNPFKPLAVSFAQWEASIWIEAGQYMNDVIGGSKPMLTKSEAVAMMPAYVKP